MKLAIRQAVLLVLVFVAFGCSSASEADLVGTWSVTKESRERLPQAVQKGMAQVLLKDDGRFDGTELPGELLYIFEPASRGLVTGSGTWTLSGGFGNQIVQLHFLEISQGGEGSVPYGTQLWVETSRGGPRLFYYSGDPDLGNRIYFSKEGVTP